MGRVKPRIFISHIHEDRGIAYQLKEFLNEAFLGFFDIFVSSDGASIRVGDNWSAIIERALHESELVIVLLSDNALDRRWIYFETGGAYFMGKRVMPLCCRGLKVSKIPSPLSWLQAVVPQDASSLSPLIAALAGAFDLREPTVDYDRLRRIVDGRYEWQELPLPGSPARRPLPVFVILDASGSMAGERIMMMRIGLTKLIDYLQSPEHTTIVPLLTIISFGDMARLVLEMRPVEEVGAIPEIEAGGVSSLGAALRLLTGIFSDPTRMPRRSLPPLVAVVLDGQPTDDWESALSAFRETVWGKRALTLCLALGEDADYKVLRTIGNEAVLPLRNPEDLLSVTRFFRWASTAVTSVAAADSKGGEIIVPPPPKQDDEVW